MSARSSCRSCQSANQSTFNGEIAIHYPGLEGLDKPIVWVFPVLRVQGSESHLTIECALHLGLQLA